MDQWQIVIASLLTVSLMIILYMLYSHEKYVFKKISVIYNVMDLQARIHDKDVKELNQKIENQGKLIEELKKKLDAQPIKEAL